MITWLFRGLFFIASVAVAYAFGGLFGNPYLGIIIGILVAAAIIMFEWLISSSPISVISSVIAGTIIGMLFAIFAQQVLMLIIGPIFSDPSVQAEFERNVKLGFMAVFVYLAIAIIYHTRDKFKVVIPYVEFRRSEKGMRPILLDTSVLLDGRIADILGTKIVEDPIIVPEMVLEELHNIADSDDKIRRERGRLGMRMLDELRKNEDLDVSIQSFDVSPQKPVDQRLVDVAKQLGARIITNDYNLNRVATIGGVEILNLNELANALKPVALPEEEINVKLLREGEQHGQAVGFLDDGTMVVVEGGAGMIGKKVPVVVTNTITRETGRIIFAELANPTSSRNRRR